MQEGRGSSRRSEPQCARAASSRAFPSSVDPVSSYDVPNRADATVAWPEPCGTPSEHAAAPHRPWRHRPQNRSRTVQGPSGRALCQRQASCRRHGYHVGIDPLSATTPRETLFTPQPDEHDPHLLVGGEPVPPCSRLSLANAPASSASRARRRPACRGQQTVHRQDQGVFSRAMTIGQPAPDFTRHETERGSRMRSSRTGPATARRAGPWQAMTPA